MCLLDYCLVIEAKGDDETIEGLACRSGQHEMLAASNIEDNGGRK